MSETGEILLNLTKATEEKDEAKIIDNLKVFPKETQLNNILLIQELLKFGNGDILKTTTELVAELAKLESNRKICTSEEIIKDLLNLLESNDPAITINSIRALGNICYENEAGCTIIDKIGANKLLSILKEDCCRENNELTTKTAGLLLNLFNNSDNLIKSSLKNGILPIVEELLLKYSQQFNKNESLLMFLVSIVNSVEHFLDEQNIPFTKELCQLLIDIFKQSKIPEISIPCLEIFHSQCEQVSASEEMKTLIAKEGVCELLFEHIEKHRELATDEESRAVLKMACDFIVVILTGDECMSLLYKDGEGIVFQNIIKWLDSEDPDLLSTGVLALGNFARKDVHCIYMMQEGISKKLLNILKKYNTSTEIEDVKIQHALLSTLKNLVIPKENKQKILRQGLINVIYPMIKINHDLVVFKLLGTFRMVIEEQVSTAFDLISRKDFIERLVYWCYNSEHLGVRGEVPRLLTWLIKYCRSVKSFTMLLSIPECIKCIVEMISSNHAIMHNEAFYALHLLYVGCPELSDENNDGEIALIQLVTILVDCKIGKKFHYVLDRYADKMDRPTIENIINLLDVLCNSEELVVHFKLVDLITPLSKLYNNTNICRIEKLNRIETLISD